MLPMEPSTFNPYTHNISIIKSFFKKPIILITAILYLVLGLALAAMLMYNTFFASFFNFDEKVVLGFLFAILSILFAVGLFIVYKASNNTNLTRTLGNGLSMLCTLARIKIAFAVIFGAALLPNLSERSDSLTDTFLFLLELGFSFVIFTVMVIGVLFYIGQNSFFTNIRKNTNSIALTSKGAIAYGVYNILFATGASQISLKFLTNEEPELSVYLIFSIVLLSCVIFIFNAIIALKYNNYIKGFIANFRITPEVRMPQMQPVYVPPVQPQSVPVQNNANFAAPVNTNVPPQKPSCPYCKALVNKDALFCQSCGNKIK